MAELSQDVIPRLNAALSGRYRIERDLGEGGIATVYLAADLEAPAMPGRFFRIEADADWESRTVE